MGSRKSPAAPSGDEHPLIRGLRWILANRRDPKGKTWSMRSLSIAAGLTPGHVEQIVNKRQSADVELPTAQALARVGQVSVAWLQTGHGEREVASVEDGEKSEPTPHTPPVRSTVRHKRLESDNWIPDHIEDLLLTIAHAIRDRVFLRKHHVAAGLFLRDFLPKLSEDMSQEKFARQALEAAWQLDEPTADGVRDLMVLRGVRTPAEDHEETDAERRYRKAQERATKTGHLSDPGKKGRS